MAGFAIWTSFAGHASLGAKAAHELRFTLDTRWGPTNAALIAFTEAVGAKSSDWNVRVFGVNPTATRTERIVTVARGRAESALGDPERWREMIANRPFRRLSEPEEVARIVAMLASPAAGYLSGTVVDLDGGPRHRG